MTHQCPEPSNLHPLGPPHLTDSHRWKAKKPADAQASAQGAVSRLRALEGGAWFQGRRDEGWDATWARLAAEAHAEKAR